MNKKEYRFQAKKIINEIKNKDVKSEIICGKLDIILSNYQKIGFYAAMDNEVNLDYLIKKYLIMNKKIALPKIIDNDLKFYYINNLNELKINDQKYKIREPIENNIVDINMLDVIIIPGLLFDKFYNRLGHGKGFYDRCLKNYLGLKIGVCFDEQLFYLIPNNLNDIKMNMIISEKNMV